MTTYNKRILVSVTGMSPAVVTETLYALVVEKGIVPTEIRVITTTQGKNKLLEQLLGIKPSGKKETGALAEFIEDYGQQYGFDHIHFDESCIQVIEDNEGNPLADIKSVEENDLAGDQIVQLIGELCQDEESQLFVSIAGGRKTMGFFMGYALSLYGRSQDSLSHVLVSSPFEGLADFHYPKPYPYLINNSKGEQFDASQAQITLADIKFVRLGLGIPTDLQKKEISYSTSITIAQKLLAEPKIAFLKNMDSRLVQFGETKPIKLAPKDYCFILGLCLAKVKKQVFSTDREHNNYLVEILEKIYSHIKNEDENFLKRINKDLPGIINDSRAELRKKLQGIFYFSKDAKIAYIPEAEKGKGLYQLAIPEENINFNEIKRELKELELI